MRLFYRRQSKSACEVSVGAGFKPTPLEYEKDAISCANLLLARGELFPVWPGLAAARSCLW